MFSKSRQKYITSLQVKKYRLHEQKFVVEGAKSVLELLQSPIKVEWIGATQEFYNENRKQIDLYDCTIISADELTKISSFKTNGAALAIACFPPPSTPLPKKDEWIIALDHIRDPGNLGTLIRTAHWFGIQQIVASPDTADIYNPKVIAAAMGSFFHLDFHYVELEEFLSASPLPVYGAFMEGKNVHTCDFPSGGILVIGNESNGISPALKPCIQEAVTIPRIGQAESLNAAIATGVILDNIFKK